MECSIAQAHRDGPRAKAEGDRQGRAAILQGGSLTPSRALYAERTRNPLAQQQRGRGAKASRLRDRRLWGSNKFSPHKSMRGVNTQHTTHMTTLWATTPRVMQKPIPRVSATPDADKPVLRSMTQHVRQREQQPCSRE